MHVFLNAVRMPVASFLPLDITKYLQEGAINEQLSFHFNISFS